MRSFGLGDGIVPLLLATLPLSGIVISGGALSHARITAIAPNPQTLFKCKTDNVFVLRRLPERSSEQPYAVRARSKSKGEIVLSVDSKSHALTLLLRSRGAPMRTYVLANVEQGSSSGSGTAGKADTTIRGRSASEVFTLFAGYENFSDDDAALMIEGRATSLLTCMNGHYAAPRAKRLGRNGSTNIFVLSADGLAQEMKTLPPEPIVESGLKPLMSEGGRKPPPR